MSYFKKRPVRGGLGGILDSYGVSGGQQTGTPSQQPQQPSSYGTPATTPPPDPTKKESGWGADLAKLFGALALNKLATPSSSPYVPPPQASTGVSTQTLLIGGALGLTALILLLK